MEIKTSPLRAAGGPGAAGGVSFHPETGSQHLAFHSRERVLRCIDQYTARQYRHQSGQKRPWLSPGPLLVRARL